LTSPDVAYNCSELLSPTSSDDARVIRVFLQARAKSSVSMISLTDSEMVTGGCGLGVASTCTQAAAVAVDELEHPIFFMEL